MSGNLVTYLRERREPVTAAELAAEVLKLQNVPEAVAARLIASLLDREKEVDRVGEDSFVYRAAPASGLALPSWLIFCVLPERASHWRDWQGAACTLLQGGRRQRLEGSGSRDGLGWPERLRSLLRSIDEAEAGIPLVFSGFGNQISLFRQAWLDLLNRPLDRPLLSMRLIAAGLFSGQRIGSAEEMAAALGTPAWSDAEIGRASCRERV